MPFNPAGLFSLVSTYFAEPGATIRTEQHNPVFEDVATALSSVLVRDGRAPMTGPLNMNGFAITGAAPGNSPTNVATLAQAMPIGAVIDFAGSAAPAGWALCYGQAVSRTVYADLFALIGTTFGVGDGSTTFNLPDARGRVGAGKDDMGGSAANRLTAAGSGINGAVLGGSGGSQSSTLVTANLPAYTPSGSVAGTFSGSGTGTAGNGQATGGNAAGPSLAATFINGAPYGGSLQVNVNVSGNIAASFTGSAQGGTSRPLVIAQPTLVLNKIIRVSYNV